MVKCDRGAELSAVEKQRLIPAREKIRLMSDDELADWQRLNDEELRDNPDDKNFQLLKIAFQGEVEARVAKRNISKYLSPCVSVAKWMEGFLNNYEKTACVMFIFTLWVIGPLAYWFLFSRSLAGLVFMYCLWLSVPVLTILRPLIFPDTHSEQIAELIRGLLSYLSLWFIGPITMDSNRLREVLFSKVVPFYSGSITALAWDNFLAIMLLLSVVFMFAAILYKNKLW